MPYTIWTLRIVQCVKFLSHTTCWLGQTNCKEFQLYCFKFVFNWQITGLQINRMDQHCLNRYMLGSKPKKQSRDFFFFFFLRTKQSRDLDTKVGEDTTRGTRSKFGSAITRRRKRSYETSLQEPITWQLVLQQVEQSTLNHIHLNWRHLG